MAQIAAGCGVHLTQLHRWKREALDKFPWLFADDKRVVDRVKEEYEAKLRDLDAEIGRLTAYIEWLKRKIAGLPREERLAMVDKGQRERNTLKDPGRTLEFEPFYPLSSADEAIRCREGS